MLTNFLNSSRIYLNFFFVALLLLNATHLHSSIKDQTNVLQSESNLNTNSDHSEIDKMELDDITYRN